MVWGTYNIKIGIFIQQIYSFRNSYQISDKTYFPNNQIDLMKN